MASPGRSVAAADTMIWSSCWAVRKASLLLASVWSGARLLRLKSEGKITDAQRTVDVLVIPVSVTIVPMRSNWPSGCGRVACTPSSTSGREACAAAFSTPTKARSVSWCGWLRRASDKSGGRERHAHPYRAQSGYGWCRRLPEEGEMSMRDSKNRPVRMILPRKGELSDPTLDFLSRAGLKSSGRTRANTMRRSRPFPTSASCSNVPVTSTTRSVKAPGIRDHRV